MILCSCTLLTKASLLEAADVLVTANPSRPVTAGRAFLACGKRPQCGSCAEMIRAMLRDFGMPVTCPEPLASVAAETDPRVLLLVPVEEPV